MVHTPGTAGVFSVDRQPSLLASDAAHHAGRLAAVEGIEAPPTCALIPK
jgi:hypothetical protein